MPGIKKLGLTESFLTLRVFVAGVSDFLGRFGLFLRVFHARADCTVHR